MVKKLLVIGMILLVAAAAFGQNVSSSVKGVVTDPTGAVVAGANLTLTNQATATAFNAKSDESGSFTFLNVLPGKYALKIEAAGFTTKTLTDLVVEASQIRTIGAVKMEVGGSTTEVSVTAQAAAIQLASAEKSGTVTGGQLENLAIKGRDFFSLLATVPGVVDNYSLDRTITTPESVQGTFINGGRDSSKNFTVDGVTDLDVGSNQTVHFQPSTDSIQEVRVLTSNYQAEYGRNGSGTITVITKGGTNEFHGTAYDFYRHESLNALPWDKKHFAQAGEDIKKDPYRARVTGYTLGGPVYIPGKLNTKKDKLFFFWSQEFSAWKRDFGTQYTRVPTELERKGDFSQSYTPSGALIPIIDPLTGLPFDGNKIPQDRWDPTGIGPKILDFFPLPNYTAGAGSGYENSRNYRSTYSGNYTRRSDMIRLDANLTPTLSAYFRFSNDADNQNVPWGNWITSMNWLLSPITFNQPGHGYTAHLTKVFSPTLVNEFTFGKSYNQLEATAKDVEAFSRSKIGLGEWFGDTDFVPNISFGTRAGGISTATVNFIGNFPYVNHNDIYSFSDNLSKVYKSHNLKFGVYFERAGKLSPVWGAPRGTIDFRRSSYNPMNTNDPFANALLGTTYSYTESSKKMMGDWWFNNLEFFAQDNWKVNSRLTLDFGVRIYHMSPVVDHNGFMATLDPRYYDASKAPRLYVPCAEGACDPGTGATASAALVGFFVPGSGDPNNGGRAAGKDGYPEGLASFPAVDFGPRFGFAYDVFGTGKTALRGGFGIFKDRGSILPAVYSAGGPPVAFQSTAYFQSITNLSGAAGYQAPSGGLYAPGGTALFGDEKTPVTYNYSLGIQQELPSNLVFDISYVGSVSRHLEIDRNINPIPIGARFNPANAAYVATGNDNFMRKYQGWGDVIQKTFGGTANYNALQVALNRRFTKGLQLGVAYTFSKALGVQSSENDYISSYFNPRDVNYGLLAQDRTHVFVANYYYDLPNLGKKFDSKPLGWIADNWAISGITTFSSGAPTSPFITWSDYRDVAGSSVTPWWGVWGGAAFDMARGQLIGDPYKNVPAGRTFNPAAFAPTPQGTYGNVSFGNLGNGILRLPGVNNWDFTVTKRVPLGSEKRYVQFRTEMFNVWNHTQYSNYDTTLVFDSPTAQVNPTAGLYNAARSPRLIQLSLKLYF